MSISFEHLGGDCVLESSLNDPLEGSSPIHRIVAFAGNRVDSPFADGELEMGFGELLFQMFKLQVDDLVDLFALERFKDNRLVDTV